MTGGLAVTRDLDTLSQRQQIEIICSNNYIKIQAGVRAPRGRLRSVGHENTGTAATVLTVDHDVWSAWANINIKSSVKHYKNMKNV